MLAYTSIIGEEVTPKVSIDEIRENTEKNPVRCPHEKTADRMIKLIEDVKTSGDSVGGAVDCISIGLPPGVSQPIFDTLEGDISKAIFAIPAVKAIEFGVGTKYAYMRGSESNDQYSIKKNKVFTNSNNAGGILGGISDGMPINLRATFKPTPSINKAQFTVNLQRMEEAEIKITGRHDPCIIPRAVPVIEATVASVLVDHLIRFGLISQTLENEP